MTAKDANELINAEYLRPSPVPSDYLATAVNPVPWPTNTPQQPRGARPKLGGERRLTGSKKIAADTRLAGRTF
jgi:hypothetical protein